jgi:BirA family transcriptional regulator, biotin operon repressor / biotin---[acetyl-CoA-carboxylase] ligase
MRQEPFQFEGWKVYEFADVSSTNLVAAELEAWCAVRADVQTAGRGRFQRGWVSDSGGLWLSAVLPLGPQSRKWKVLPLVIGVAVCDTIRQLGVDSLRMRWPNDILVEDAKLAGILVDRFAPGLAVAGVGINITNDPERHDRSLKGAVARLADLMKGAPGPGDLARAVLVSLRSVWRELESAGSGNLWPRVNALWQTPRLVQLDLDGRLVSGIFDGVDDSGRLLVRQPGGETNFYEPHEVRLFREVTEHS